MSVLRCLGLLALWLMVGCAPSASDRYEIHTISRETLSDIVTATGVVEPVSRVEINSAIAGKVIAVLVEPGQAIVRGQVIARLDDSISRAAVIRAEADLRAGEMALMRARLKAQQLNDDLGRRRKLVVAGFLSDKALEAQTSEWRQQVIAVDEADQRVKSLRADFGIRRSELASTEITAPIDGIVLSVDIKPGQMVTPGLNADSTGAPRPVAVLATALDPMVVSTAVAEQDVGRLRPGMTVRLHVDAYPDDAFTGTIATTALEARRKGSAVTYDLRVLVPNTSGKLRPGMTVAVELINTEVLQALTIPADALYFTPPDYKPDLPEGLRRRVLAGGRDPASVDWKALEYGYLLGRGKSRVFVLTRKGVEKRVIVLGAEANDLLEVRGGLAAGDRVILRARALEHR